MHSIVIFQVILQAVKERIGEENILCDCSLKSFSTDATAEGCNVIAYFQNRAGQDLPPCSAKVLRRQLEYVLSIYDFLQRY